MNTGLEKSGQQHVSDGMSSLKVSDFAIFISVYRGVDLKHCVYFSACKIIFDMSESGARGTTSLKRRMCVKLSHVVLARF